jgi:hypothetical protein
VRTHVVAAAAGAVLMSLAGFAAMNIWWLAEQHHSAVLPGLYAFYSATWGDGIVLPLATAALLLLAKRLAVGRPAISRPVVLIAAVAGTLVAAASQVMWLVDPAPRLNWTLRAPHHFTAAGWYHAAFTTGAAAAVAALFGVVVMRLHQLRFTAPGEWDTALRGTTFTVFLLSISGFVALVVRDGIDRPFAVAQLGTWGAVLGGILVFVLVIMLVVRASAAVLISRLSTVLLWSTIVLTATYVQGHYRVGVFTAVSVGVSVALVLGQQGRRITTANMIAVAAVSVASTTTMSIVVQQQPRTIWTALIATGIAALVSPLFLLIAFGLRPTWGDIVAVGPPFLLLAAIGVWLIQADFQANQTIFNVALAVATLGPSILLKQVTAARFEVLVHVEMTADETTRNTVAVRVWSWLIGSYGAALVALVTLTVGAVVSKGFQQGGADERLHVGVLLAGAAGVCVAGGCTVLLGRCSRLSPTWRPMVFVPALTGAAVWVALILSTQPFPYRLYYTPWPLVTALVMAAVTWESVISNVARLNRKQPSATTRAAAAGLGALAVINVYWVLAGVASGAGNAEPLPRALIAVGLVTVVQVIMLVCVGAAAQLELRDRATPYATWFNLAQDGVLFLGLVWVFGFIPLFVYRHMEPLTNTKLWETALALGPTLSFTGAVLLMALENNSAHLERKTAEADAATSQQRDRMMPIDRLRSHIKFQNRTAVVLAGTTLIGLVEALRNWKLFMQVLFASLRR